MKHFFVLLLLAHAALSQTAKTEPASISGMVIDAKTQKPIPAALVIASRDGTPPFTRNTKSGADGAYQIQGLTPGDYLVCVQVLNDQYLNPCEWNGAAPGVTVSSGQASTGIKIALTPASLLKVEVKDTRGALHQLTRDGRRPDLRVGVWGPDGQYHPARAQSGPTPIVGSQANSPTYSYQLAVPRDTALTLYIASRDLQLGDDNAVALSENTSRRAFQHVAGDSHPKSFTFTVLGKLP
jgi:hypothetical protein